jgi:CubicO group peptidase (beta-lactamase class C family)
LTIRHLGRLLAAALIASCAIAVNAAAAEPPLDPATLRLIPNRMQEFVDRGEISGVVTLVARNGQIAALDAAGFADIENRKPMRTDTTCRSCRRPRR